MVSKTWSASSRRRNSSFTCKNCPSHSGSAVVKQSIKSSRFKQNLHHALTSLTGISLVAPEVRERTNSEIFIRKPSGEFRRDLMQMWQSSCKAFVE